VLACAWKHCAGRLFLLFLFFWASKRKEKGISGRALGYNAAVWLTNQIEFLYFENQVVNSKRSLFTTSYSFQNCVQPHVLAQKLIRFCRPTDGKNGSF
jgi:hypothetical protein